MPSNAPSSPDWSKVSFHPRCPLCDYDLYGRQTPRCSECGYPFDWSEVLDPRLDVHPYLFEQHPEANLRSYWSTFKKAFRAKSFWSQLHPLQRPVTRRLLLYWGIGLLVFLLGVAISCVVTRMGYWARGRSWAGGGGPSNLQLLGNYFLTGYFLVEVVLTGIIIPLAIPWMIWLVLLIFRMSMRRARVRSSHVLRSVLYSCDPSSWIIFLLPWCIVPLYAIIIDPTIMRWWDSGFSRPLICAAPIALMATYRLWMAYRYYLRFDHPLTTVLAAIAIVALVAINVFYKLTLW